MDPLADLDLALAALSAVATRWQTALDGELLADGAAWEAAGRLIDARRAAFAAEVEVRSKKRLSESGLAFRHGERDAANLVAQVTRTAVREAKRRVEIGTALAPRRSLSGEQLPGRFPVLGDAFQRGAVGVDAASRTYSREEFLEIADTIPPFHDTWPPSDHECGFGRLMATDAELES